MTPETSGDVRCRPTVDVTDAPSVVAFTRSIKSQPLLSVFSQRLHHSPRSVTRNGARLLLSEPSGSEASPKIASGKRSEPSVVVVEPLRKRSSTESPPAGSFQSSKAATEA